MKNTLEVKSLNCSLAVSITNIQTLISSKTAFSDILKIICFVTSALNFDLSFWNHTFGA